MLMVEIYRRCSSCKTTQYGNTTLITKKLIQIPRISTIIPQIDGVFDDIFFISH